MARVYNLLTTIYNLYTPLMFLVDCHLDIAWNALSFDRDVTQSAKDTRKCEQHTALEQEIGQCMLGYPEMREAGVGLICATVFALPKTTDFPGNSKFTYTTLDEANALAWEQLHYYQELTTQHPDKFRLIKTKKELNGLSALPKEKRPIGIVLLMENAEPIRNEDDLQQFWDAGVRIIGPAWQKTRFCGGTGSPGPLTKDGKWLLSAMSARGFILDISHMDREAVEEAFAVFSGPILASHSNPGALIKQTNRHISDTTIKAIAERKGIIGTVFYNRFLTSSWKDDDPKATVPLERIVECMEYTAKIAGQPTTVCIGSDIDGSFGAECTPEGMDTVRDFVKIPPLLKKRGWKEEDIAGVMGKNAFQFFQKALPKE